MRFSRKHIIATFNKALSQGISPRKLAITCALGVVIGLFPIWGITTWICLGLAITLRLNVVVMQLVNYLLFPAQIALILPFVNAGIWMFGLPDFPYNNDELVTMFRTDFFGVMKETGIALAAGVGVWALIALPLFGVIFYSSLALFNRMSLSTNEN